MILQLAVSTAVVIFLWRKTFDESRLQVFWAPLLSMISMAGTIILAVNNLQYLSGSNSAVVKMIPWIIAASALAG